MKKIYKLTVLSALMLAGCSASNKNFDKVTRGMKKSEVIKLVSEPETKATFMGADRWTYASQNKAIIFSKDTVERVIRDLKANNDSIKNFLEKMGSPLDSAKAK
jgi:outer membrane protein assembly factor BamE (lipoprotein component of BamABCDE complex)